MAIGIVNSGGGTAVKVDGASVGTLDITKLTTWNNDLIDIIDAPVTDDKGKYSVYNIGGDMHVFFRGIDANNQNYYKMFKYDDTNKNWIDVSESYPIYGTSIIETTHDILTFKHNGETYSAYFDRDPYCEFSIPVSGQIFSSISFSYPDNNLVIRNESTGVLTNISVSQLFAPALTNLAITVQKVAAYGRLNAKFVSAGRIYFGLYANYYSSSSSTSVDKIAIAIMYYDIDTRTPTYLRTLSNVTINDVQSNFYTMACPLNSGSPGCAQLFKGTISSGGSLTLEDTTFFTSRRNDSSALYVCGFPAVLPSDKKTLAHENSTTALFPYSNSSEKFYVSLSQISGTPLYNDVLYTNSSAKYVRLPNSYLLCYDEPYLYIIWEQNIQYDIKDNNTQTQHTIVETASRIKSDVIYKSSYAISRHRVTKRLDSEYTSKACSLYYMDDLNPLDADESGLFTVNGKAYQLFTVFSSDGINLNRFIKAITVHNNKVYVIFDKIYEQGLYYRASSSEIRTKTDPLTNSSGMADIYQLGTGSEPVILRAGDVLYGYTLEHPMGKVLSNKCAVFELPWNSSNHGSAHTLLNE